MINTIKIRQWQPADARPLAEVLNNKNVLDDLRDGLPYPYTEADAAAFISAMLTADRNNTFAWAVTVDGTVVGGIGAFRKDNVHRLTAEMGYYVAEAYWGKGVMTEAVKQACAYIFEKTDIIRIFAEPFSTNAASCRVLEKAGFVYEGTLRKHVVKNERVLDSAMYAIIKMN